MINGYFTAVQNVKPVCEFKSAFYVFFTGNGRKLTQNVDFSDFPPQTGFTYWTAVR